VKLTYSLRGVSDRLGELVGPEKGENPLPLARLITSPPLAVRSSARYCAIRKANSMP